MRQRGCEHCELPQDSRKLIDFRQAITAVAAYSSASSTKSVRMELPTRQPTVRWANTTMTKATYSQPCRVRDVREVADPELVRPLGPDLPVDPV